MSLVVDAETKATETATGDELRLWLRLFTCFTLVDSEVRRRLRERFEATLPRFDLMAQLERAEEGMPLGEISRRMMVSNGNVTGLVERLTASGQIERWADPLDRRVQMIRLTESGHAEFTRMASEHADWIAQLFAGLAPNDVSELLRLLGRLKASVTAALEPVS